MLTNEAPAGFGIFAAEYARVGVATFPVRNKRPAVKYWQRIGVNASLKLAARPEFADAGLGFCCGARSGLTVVDVDEVGEPALVAALRRFGDTPLIAQTASGKHHLYYKHAHERRKIRLDGEPTDLLGEGGFCVAPPTTTERGVYRFIRGRLDDLRQRRQLPEAKVKIEMSPAAEALADAIGTASDIGRRDADLFTACRAFAATATTFTEIEKFALTMNAAFSPPLPDAQARQKAQQAWHYRKEGRLLVPGCEPCAFIRRSDLEALSGQPRAFTLWALIRVHHGADPEKRFALTISALKQKLHAGERAVSDAINYLITTGRLERVHRGGARKGDPSLYRIVRAAC